MTPQAQTQALTHLPEWFRIAAPRAMFGTKEVAKLFGVSEQVVRRMAGTGKLPEPVKMESHLHSGHRAYDYSLRWSKAQLLVQLRTLRAQTVH